MHCVYVAIHLSAGYWQPLKEAMSIISLSRWEREQSNDLSIQRFPVETVTVRDEEYKILNYNQLVA